MSPVLLLLLLTSLAGIGQLTDPSDEEEVPTSQEPSSELDIGEDDTGSSSDSAGYNNDNNTTDPLDNSTDTTDTPEEDQTLTIILCGAVVGVVIIGTVLGGIAMSRKRNKMTTSGLDVLNLTYLIVATDGMNDSYLQVSSTEKVPMPMFDDDIPSVLELEMEDMDQWVENGSKHVRRVVRAQSGAYRA
ncbi:hypothetical protein NHX12_017532 [Muraenolepis orangiensis]|uniref:Uncharacterized protein n=1 Tax=Muraenolepis orangiensis TaxID=630683 RepID=A0A9Q0EVE3_9TELE|nr:hypothetical protein NHX12_017532 [Muraenolepis orangiensis]